MSRLVAGEDFWAYDPDRDSPGSMLEAVDLLDYWRARGIRFTVRGLTLQVQEPTHLVGKLLTAIDLTELGDCECHIRSLLKLEAQGEYNLGLTSEDSRALQDSTSHPPL